MLRVCANCRVLVQPAGNPDPDHPFLTWEHVPEFAEKFSRAVCSDPAPGREPSRSEARFGLARMKSTGGDKHVIKGALAESDLSPGIPITVGVDGSYKLTVTDKVIKPMSWGYLTTTGLFGLGTAIVPGSLVGGQRWLQAELRAIGAALHAIGPDHPVTVLSDCQDAITFVNLWRAGHEVWPRGYQLERSGGRESTLGRLRELLLRDPDRITIEWVPGHTGHPLNEAADALAKLARAWTTGQIGKDETEADARWIGAAALKRYAAMAA